jgi:hypothetical protein
VNSNEDGFMFSLTGYAGSVKECRDQFEIETIPIQFVPSPDLIQIFFSEKPDPIRFRDDVYHPRRIHMRIL